MTEKIKGLEVDLEIQENKQMPTKKQSLGSLRLKMASNVKRKNYR